MRAVWDDENAKWWFSVLDIIGVLRDCDDYEKNRNYWKYLKARLKREGSQLGSVTTQFKFALTDKIIDREVFMKGIDYSYYYEQEDGIPV